VQRAFIGAHEVGNPLGVRPAHLEQLVGGRIGIRDARHLRRGACVLFGQHRPAAGREIQARCENVATGIARQETHGVPVEGERAVDDQAHVLRGLEADPMAAVEQQPALGFTRVTDNANAALSQRSGASPLRPATIALSLPCSRPLKASPPYNSASIRVVMGNRPSAASSWTKRSAARCGPTV
jgi:hypothetical protein